MTRQLRPNTRRRPAAVLSAIGVALAAPGCASPVAAAEPVVSVWYRGTPVGAPRAEDLGAIRALGFTGVTWPRELAGGVEPLRRLAATVSLTVIVSDPPVPLTAASALAPGDRVSIAVGPSAETAALAVTLAWRALAHGARVISFDSGAADGAGLEQADRSLRPWARAAIAFARQVAGNARLVDVMRPGPRVSVSPARPPTLDVVLLDADRAWVLVATNTSGEAMEATVRLPAGTPYAIWINWLDGSTLAMIGEPAGPRWTLRLEARSARAYLIDKIMK